MMSMLIPCVVDVDHEYHLSQPSGAGGEGERATVLKTNTDKEEQHDKHRDKVMCNKESNEGGEESEQ